MNWKCEAVEDPRLKPADGAEEFILHLAALEWSLSEPIIINGEEDIQAVNWRARGLTPYLHQVQNLITFCRKLPVALIADDVGLGKTISAGLILSELVARRRVRRTFVICPKVLTTQWVGELETKFGLSAVDATGAALDRAISGDSPIVVTTYDSARTRLDKLQPGVFDFCILDEAHKLRNLHGTQKPPAMAVSVRNALERRPFKFVLMLTATPIQNRIWDLYSLIDLLKVAEGRINPLGKPDEFSANYLEPGTGGRSLRKRQTEHFQSHFRDCFSRTRRVDVRLPFPERRIELVRLELTPEETRMVAVVGAHVAELSALLQVSVLQAMSSSPQALAAQATNMREKGSFSESIVAELKALAAAIVLPAKLRHLLQVVKQLRAESPGQWRLVVFTVRRETQAMIGAALKANGIECGFIRGANSAGNQRDIRDFSATPPRVSVLVSTDAGAEGVNLQAGNVLVNYDLPWNPMIVEQRIGRVQRLGSNFRNVIIINLVGRGTIEDSIVARLLHKLQGVSQAIGDIEGILQAANMEDEDSRSFESIIREYAVAWMQGKDVELAKRQTEASIDQGRKLWDEELQLIDRTLGDANAGPAPAKPMPRIERKQPSLPAREFVLRAKRTEGLVLRETARDLFEASASGRVTERISFAESDPATGIRPVFADRLAKCYLPGEPAFERLVQHWVDHQAHRVLDRKPDAAAASTALAKSWCAGMPGCAFQDAIYKPDSSRFHGKVHILIRAGTGVDSYEKLVSTTFPSNNGWTIAAAKESTSTPRPTSLSDVMTNSEQAVRAVVNLDTDVDRFCRYYLDRLEEGVADTEDRRQRAKIESDFRPTVQAQIVAIDGVGYDEGTLHVTFLVEGQTYEQRLAVIPAAATIVRGADVGTCSMTNAVWPTVCLAKCEATGKLVLKHRLVETTAGRLILPDELVTCAVSGDRIPRADSAVSSVSARIARSNLFEDCCLTGDRLLPDERERSSVSMRVARKDQLVASEKSGRRAMPDEVVRCAITNALLLPDEATRSATTGEWYSREALVASALSGIKMPPPDLVPCEATGDMVLPEERAVCRATGVFHRRDLLVQSAVSGKLLARTSAVILWNGTPALPKEVGGCQWTNQWYPLVELGTCILTGLTVAADRLNDASELTTLRRLLDGRYAEKDEYPADPKLPTSIAGWEQVKPSTAVCRAGPRPGIFVIVAEGSGLMNWFLERTRIHGAVVRIEGKTIKVLGKTVYGERNGNRWKPIK